MVEFQGNPVLVIIDVQKAWTNILPGKWNNPDAVANISKLLYKWRSSGWKVIHVRHDSKKPDSPLKKGNPGFYFQDEVMPQEGETVITKHVNSAFIGTNLEAILRINNAGTVVMCGFVTDHCVSTTARMSGNLGFNTVVPEDSCATYSKKWIDGTEVKAEDLHKANLASINGEFAKVVRTEELL